MENDKFDEDEEINEEKNSILNRVNKKMEIKSNQTDNLDFGKNNQNNSVIFLERFKNSKNFNILSKNEKKCIMSIPQEEQNNIILILDEIQQLKNTNININIEKYPTLIINQNLKEKNLEDIFPNFHILIENESKEEIEKRKNNFKNLNYFNGTINLNPLTDYISQCEIFQK